MAMYAVLQGVRRVFVTPPFSSLAEPCSPQAAVRRSARVRINIINTLPIRKGCHNARPCIRIAPPLFHLRHGPPRGGAAHHANGLFVAMLSANFGEAPKAEVRRM